MAGKQADIKVGVITDYDDKGLRGAKNSLANFKTAIADADGIGGKFKAGFESVATSVKANAGALAVAGGAALIAFGVKAVGAFTDTAKAALDLGAATGLSTEQASRWIAVADDMGVSADALQAGIGKIGKTLDGAQWKQYGIATRDAGGEARDTNDILLDSLDTLGRIPNETERAKAGNALFGKGYANLAPLIGKTREEMEKYLGSVERGQVITEAEAKKAEKFRLAQDQLGDALKDVTIAIGEQVAALAPLLVKAAQLLTFVTGASEGSSDFGDELARLAKQYDLTGDQQQDYFTDLYVGKTTIEEVRKELEATAIATAVAARSTEDHAAALKLQALNTGQARDATHDLTGAEEDLKAAQDKVTEAVDANKRHNEALERSVTAGVDRMINKWKEIQGTLSDEEAWLSLQSQFDDVKAAFEETAVTGDKSTQEIEQGIRDAASAMAQLKIDVINYGVEVLKLPDEKMTRIFAAVNPESLAEAEALLAALTRNRDMSISITTKGGAGYGTGPAFAEGGVVPGLKGAPVAATVHGGETVRTPEQEEALNGGGGGSTTVNIYPQFMPTPKQLANILAQYDRHNATNIVTPVGR